MLSPPSITQRQPMQYSSSYHNAATANQDTAAHKQIPLSAIMVERGSLMGRERAGILFSLLYLMPVPGDRAGAALAGPAQCPDGAPPSMVAASAVFPASILV